MRANEITVVKNNRLTENESEKYRGEHRAPGKESGAPLHDLTSVYPDDIYGPMAAQYYGHYGQNHPLDKETINKIQRMHGKPNQGVQIYRAVPKGIKNIYPGDWVTINKNYAVEHGESALRGKYNILTKIVSAKNLYTDGNSIHEFGYDPSAVETTSVTETKQNLDEISTISSFDPSVENFVLSSADEKRIKNKMKPLPGDSGYAYVIENYGREVYISIVDPKNLDYSVGELEIAKFPVNISNEDIFQVGMIKVHPEHRGRGIAKALYGLVLLPKPIGLGATLISDSTQSPGGIQNWVSLSKIPGVEVTGLVRIINYEDKFNIRSKNYDKLLNNLFGKIGGFLYGEQKPYYYYQIPVELVDSRLENTIKKSLITIYQSTKPTSISYYYKSFLMAKYDNDNQEMSEDTVDEARKRKQKKAKLARVYGAVSYNFDSGDGGGIEESLNEAPIADYETLGDFSDTEPTYRSDALNEIIRIEREQKQSVSEDTVDEMALSTYKTMGDFSKPGPFTGADKKLVPHPKNIEKATRFFEKTPFDFRLFFSNLKGTGKYSEHGPMTPDELRKVFGQDAEEIINGSEDAITVVYVGNKGDAKVMLSPWVMAHRFGHAIQAGSRWEAWSEAEKYFFQTVNSFLAEHYGKVDRGPSSYMGRPKSEQMNYNLIPEYNALFNAIGTQRSSRSGQIRRPYEFLYELFAQYLGTGKITLNPLPTNLGYGRKAWGNPTKFMNIKSEYRDEGERKQEADSLAYTMELLFNDVLNASVGKIFVM